MQKNIFSVRATMNIFTEYNLYKHIFIIKYMLIFFLSYKILRFDIV